MKKISIAIDGPAGAGKSTVAKLVAQQLAYKYIDTGAMFRAITWYALSEKLTDTEISCVNIKNVDISMDYSDDYSLIVKVNGMDVSNAIRSSTVTSNVSLFAQKTIVREKLLEQQRKMAIGGGIVMDGRDIGSVVLPDAELKIFLTASANERALRRAKDIKARGEYVDIEALEKEITARDNADMNRKNAPLVCLSSAWLFDTTNYDLQQVVNKIVSKAREVINAV